MDPFALIIIAGIGGLLLWVLLIGKMSEGRGLEQMGLRTAREVVESREALDAEDLDQMLTAANARRRARGEREVTVEDLEMRVVAEQHELARRRAELASERAAESELDQLLEATNARRRARGEPERTREQVQREFGSATPPRPVPRGEPPASPGA